MTPKINYADLYDYLCEEVAQHGECNGLGHCTYDFVYDVESVGLCGTVRATFRYVDDTFSHAFGIETCGHWEFDSLDDIDVEYCGYLDIEGNDHVLQFDYGKFNQLIN